MGRKLNEGRVLYPWRVELAFMVFSEEPIQRKYIRIADYIEGYGIGESPQHELTALLSALNSKSELKHAPG